MPVTVTKIDYGLPFTSNHFFEGAVAAPNGRIYVAPSTATTFWVIDTTTDTASFSALGANLTGQNKWRDGVLAPNGWIYWAPYYAPDILAVNTSTNLATRLSMGLPNMQETQKWHATALSNDGRIFSPPDMANDILIINPQNNTAVRTPMGLDFSGKQWFAAATGSDGKIYCPPGYGSDKILVIDPLTNSATLTNMGASIPVQQQIGWFTAVAAPNGKIYCIPYQAGDFLVIDPLTETAYLTNFGLSLPAPGVSKWRAAALGPDGKIYGFPYTNVPFFVVIDPKSETAEITTFDTDLSDIRVRSAVISADGRFYGIPYGGTIYNRVVVLSGFLQSGVYLRDPITGDYYSHPDGEVVKRMDFGIIGAGRTTDPKPVVVENQTGVTVETLTIDVESEPNGIDVEVSLSDDPFEPEKLPLMLSGPFPSGQDAVTLWIRVSTTNQSVLDQYVVRMNVSATEV